MKYSGQIEFTIIDTQSDQVIAEMPVTPGMLNPFGTVHAGATIWFADVTATTLALEGKALSPGMQGFPLAINLNANLAGNQSDGTFRATARYVKRGRMVSVIRTTVTGANDRLIADVTTSHVASGTGR